MTETEFEILDELYFLIDFKTLLNNVNFDENILKNSLRLMIEKNWIALFMNDDSAEINYDNTSFEENFKSYYYLATKKGLFEHNSN